MRKGDSRLPLYQARLMALSGKKPPRKKEEEPRPKRPKVARITNADLAKLASAGFKIR